MAYIVLSVGRPFCYGDFTNFEVDGRKWSPSYGTIRNKFSKFRKEGRIKICCNSKPVFFELTETNLGNKTMTMRPTGASNTSRNDPLYNMLTRLPWDKHCIHNIHLKFKAPGIYKILSENSPYPKVKGNEGIAIPAWAKNNTIAKITVNKNDTLIVIIGCSLEPIPLDYYGIIRFFTILTRVEGFLEGITRKINDYKWKQSIPHYGNWIITRWDFGRDSLQTYTGEKYETTVEGAEHIFTRIYTKDFGKYKRIRIENVECLGKTVFDGIQEKLDELYPIR
jgi:hypothetical protein